MNLSYANWKQIYLTKDNVTDMRNEILRMRSMD